MTPVFHTFFSDVATRSEKGFPESTTSIRTTSLTTQQSTVVIRTTDVSTDATDGPNTSRDIVTAGGNATCYTNETQSRVTPAPATSPDLFSSSNHRGTRTTLNAFSDQSAASDASTSHGGSASASTRETRDDASPRSVQPEVKPTTGLGENSTLGNITAHPGNTSAPTALSSGDRVPGINEGNFIIKKKNQMLFWSVSQCLLCSSSGMCVMAEVKQMQLQKVNKTSLKSAEKQSRM